MIQYNPPTEIAESPEDRLINVTRLQTMMVLHATGGSVDNDEYVRFRNQLLTDPLVRNRLPFIIKVNPDIYQFWAFIKHKFPTYAERRAYIWDDFRPLMKFLEDGSTNPVDELVGDTLSRLDIGEVQEVWQKALDRRSQDPGGAITSARSLVETVCKLILDDAGVAYNDDGQLKKLYASVASVLNLAPGQQSEQTFKQILGGCQTVVEGVYAIRNEFGDAHGMGAHTAKPHIRHAELAVNLAGSLATFLVSTWIARED